MPNKQFHRSVNSRLRRLSPPGELRRMGGLPNAEVTEGTVLEMTIRAYAAAWAARDREAWLRTFAADATQEDPVDAICQRWAQIVRTEYDIEWEISAVVEAFPGLVRIARQAMVSGTPVVTIWRQ